MPAELDPSAILAGVGEAPYCWDIASDALAWGANVSEVLQIADPTKIATGRRYAQLLTAETQKARFEAVMRSGHRDHGRGVPYQVTYSLCSGQHISPLWIEDTGRWFAGPDGQPQRAQGVVRVINERHAEEERLAFLSRFDPLTGEMNRWHLTECLGAALDEAIRLRFACSLLLVGIDNLARINEAYGYEVADEVIAAVAKRLRTKMRGRDLLGRYAGNTFGVILKNCTPEDMAIAADRLLAAVRDEVIQTSAGAVSVTVTIGGISAPRHARTVQEILARAQEALDAMKAKRRGAFLAYRPAAERDLRRRENIRATDEIVTALNERRILVAFEPVVHARTRAPAFYECLMRIRRSDGSLVPAATIIPVAERLGLVRLLDQRMLELVIAELARDPSLRVSLNVSPASTTDPDWWAALTAQLRAHRDLGRRLTIEITETAAIHDIEETRGFVMRTKDLGCRIAIDDFGAGNTSFRNLRKLGADLLKIDGEFVQNLTGSPDDRAFVRAMLDLAKALHLETVAEWVQDEAAAAMLTGWGCDYLQGALLGLASLQRGPLLPTAKGQARPRVRAAAL